MADFKDLLQLIEKHLNKKSTSPKDKIKLEKAKKLLQSGDRTDWIKGLETIGKIFANGKSAYYFFHATWGWLCNLWDWLCNLF